MTVVISRSLQLSLGDAPATELAHSFYAYKVAGTESFGASFGRDKPLGMPVEARSRQLWHVHLEDAQSIASWDYISENFDRRGFSQDNFTSDTILVYGYAPRAPKSPYILLNILSPNGHEQMREQDRMKALCHVWDTELADYQRLMPCDNWIIVQ